MYSSSIIFPAGSYNSSDRFTRAAMLQRPAALWSWPPKELQLSPSFVADGVPEDNGNIMTNMIMANALYLPMGVDDAGGIQIQGNTTHRDMTWWTSVKDHHSLVSYYRVANNPQWQRIQLSTVPWSRLGGIMYADMDAGVWFVDKSYDKRTTKKIIKHGGRKTLA